ncbi:MAG: helix-turn-helix transcriptional regulator [Oscillospiraceae bacterium]|nr:helix-turn-helix transcriptional regulator [Oscillospiraceae bacterium]
MKEAVCPYRCPVETTLDLIGGKYKALILWRLSDRTMRYNELQKIMPQATPKMLTQQLRELESDGLLTRTVYPVVPPKVEYAISAYGQSLRPVLEAMYDWGESHLEQQGIEARCPIKVRADGG